MPPDSLSMFREGGVRLLREWALGPEDEEVLLELRPRLRRGERHGDRRVLEDEPVPVRRPWDREPGRVVVRRAQQRSPPEGCVGDDRQPEARRDREDLTL